ncbi:MAG: hypothetical protein H9W81_08830 [Enterococcus sp.]|nr:hypothetical protein [Enterococcus sp.]
MRDMYNSPAMDFFTDMVFVVAGERTQDPETGQRDYTETILYINPHLDEKTVNIGLYDDPSHSYLINSNPGSYASAETILRKIDSDYPGKIDMKAVLEMLRVFYTVAPGVRAIEDKVSLEMTDCENCGTNVDEFFMVLVPSAADTPLTEASLNLHWEFGCFGGDAVNGVFSEVKDDAEQMLRRMLPDADRECKDGIKEALDILKNFSATI